MKVLYQWAQKNPTSWQQIDAQDWATLPKHPIPKPGQLGGQNNQPGWIRNVSVQGITAEGFDHVAIERITIGLDEGVNYTTWNDDPDDYPIGERNAIVWTILPLAPDPKLGMAINTRQSCIRYCEGERYDRLLAHSPQNTTIRPWTEFVPPSNEITRHGVWLADAKLAEHISKAPQSEYGWMHWNEHLPDSECELDKKGRRVLKEQRKQGRYKQAEHTITYYQRDTNRANLGVYTNEDALETTTAASATETVTTDSNLNRAWSFGTANPNPGSADWPNGTFHAQLNSTAASSGLTYGISTTEPGVGLGFNGFARAGTGPGLSDAFLPTNGNGDENDFSGTGLKLATATGDAAAGLTTNVFVVYVTATGDSHGDAITLTLNTTDSYADGPWSAGETITADKWHPLIEQPLAEITRVVSYMRRLIHNLVFNDT